jgi:outer membrane protein OmpA-like peptidoglycan-associated protein
LFDESRIWGKVFDDQDGDGWQDEGERGIPGVRLATVEGLIAETDSKGRFHIEGLRLSNQERGQNYVVKVDASTLPEGSVFTTENPLLRRLTPGVPVRFDFGVKLPPSPKAMGSEEVILEPGAPPGDPIRIGSVYFDTDRTTIKSEYNQLLDTIAAKIESDGCCTVWITGYADLRGSDEYNRDLALRRARAVFDDISKRLSPTAKAKLKVEVEGLTSTGAGK